MVAMLISHPAVCFAPIPARARSPQSSARAGRYRHTPSIVRPLISIGRALGHARASRERQAGLLWTPRTRWRSSTICLGWDAVVALSAMSAMTAMNLNQFETTRLREDVRQSPTRPAVAHAGLGIASTPRHGGAWRLNSPTEGPYQTGKSQCPEEDRGSPPSRLKNRRKSEIEARHDRGEPPSQLKKLREN